MYLYSQGKDTHVAGLAPSLQANGRVQELCESGGGRPGLPVPNKPTVSVDVKQHFNGMSSADANLLKENRTMLAWKRGRKREAEKELEGACVDERVG